MGPATPRTTAAISLVRDSAAAVDAARLHVLKRKNARLIAALEQLRADYRDHMRQLAELFRSDARDVDAGWDEGFDRLKNFVDCTALLADRTQ